MGSQGGGQPGPHKEKMKSMAEKAKFMVIANEQVTIQYKNKLE